MTITSCLEHVEFDMHQSTCIHVFVDVLWDRVWVLSVMVLLFVLSVTVLIFVLNQLVLTFDLSPMLLILVLSLMVLDFCSQSVGAVC